MNAIGLVALRELKDHWRNPGVILGALGFYVLIEVLFVSLFGFVGILAEQPEMMLALGIAGKEELGFQILTGYNSYVVLEPMTLATILGVYGLINDRENSTFAFLLLSPISRWQLILGKTLGCSAIPIGLHVVIGTLQAFSISRFEVTQSHPELLPFSVTWFVGFILSTGLWTLVAAALSVLIGGLIRDVRSAHSVGSVITFVLLVPAGGAVAYLLGDLLPQLGLMVLAVFCLAILVGLGQLVISRDVSR